MEEERSPIDAKRMPGVLVIGIILVIIGVIIIISGIHSIVMWGLGEPSRFGLVGGIFIIPLGGIIALIGIMAASISVFRRVFGRRRILY